MLNRDHRFHGFHALDFAYKRGQSVRASVVSLKYALNDRRQTYRVAVVVSKKVSKSAVVRNRIRRRLYEVVREQAANIIQPYDLIFMVYDVQVATMDTIELQSSVLGLLKKAGVIV